MRLIYAMLLGFILDLIFGDPHGLIHPVQIIGWFIDKLKKGMQHMIYGCSYEEVREKEIERKAGVEKTAGFFLMLFYCSRNICRCLWNFICGKSDSSGSSLLFRDIFYLSDSCDKEFKNRIYEGL